MFNNHKDDIFSFNVQFRNDIIFTEISTIRLHLLHALTENMKIIVNLIERQTIDYNEYFKKQLNAGAFFNMSTISKSIIPFTDEELMIIASSFRNTIAKSKFSTVCNKTVDPLETLKYFTKYFYIPVRLDYNTIPQTLQIFYLKQWLSIICIIFSVDSYVDKYQQSIPEIEIYKTCFNQFLDKDKKEVMCSKISTIDVQSIDKFLVNNLNESVKIQVFYHCLNKLFINANIEIIRRFCPNFNVVKNINPKCDGDWISPFDEDVNFQIQQLENINKIN